MRVEPRPVISVDGCLKCHVEAEIERRKLLPHHLIAQCPHGSNAAACGGPQVDGEWLTFDTDKVTCTACREIFDPEVSDW